MRGPTGVGQRACLPARARVYYESSLVQLRSLKTPQLELYLWGHLMLLIILFSSCDSSRSKNQRTHTSTINIERCGVKNVTAKACGGRESVGAINAAIYFYNILFDCSRARRARTCLVTRETRELVCPREVEVTPHDR